MYAVLCVCVCLCVCWRAIRPNAGPFGTPVAFGEQYAERGLPDPSVRYRC
jgi:hypothetical protein